MFVFVYICLCPCLRPCFEFLHLFVHGHVCLWLYLFHIIMPIIICLISADFLLLYSFQSYSAIGIRVVVVAMEIQNNGPTFERVSNGDTQIRNFKAYYNKIKEEGKLKDISLDVGIFLR